MASRKVVEEAFHNPVVAYRNQAAMVAYRNTNLATGVDNVTSFHIAATNHKPLADPTKVVGFGYIVAVRILMVALSVVVRTMAKLDLVEEVIVGQLA